MIDPKPYVGDPTGFAERMAGLLDLDAERLRLWLFARCVQESPGWPALHDTTVALAPT